MLAPVVGRGHAQRHTLDGPPPRGATVAPTDAPPARLGRRDDRHRGRLHPGLQGGAGAGASVAAAGWPHEAWPPQKHFLASTKSPQHTGAATGATWLETGRYRRTPASASTPVTVIPLARTWAEQRQRLAPLLLKADAGRNPRPRPGSIGQPGLGQVQRGPQQIPAQPCPQGRRDRHLAIGDFPQGPTVLAPHPHGVVPLFGKARAVDDQHALALGQHLPQPSPDLVGPPGGVGDEMLEGLIGPGLGHARQHRVHRFARAVAEQPLHVPAQRQPLRPMPEALVERFEPPHQAAQLGHGATGVHCRAAYRIQRKSTMSSKQITRAFSPKSCDLTK